MVDSLLPKRNSWLALKITAFSSKLLIYYKRDVTHSYKRSGKETQRTTTFVISTIGKHLQQKVYNKQEDKIGIGGHSNLGGRTLRGPRFQIHPARANKRIDS